MLHVTKGTDRFRTRGYRSVAADSMLRERLTVECSARNLDLHLTPPQYCTDNAAMIAAHGYHLLRLGRTSDLHLSASASA